MKLKKRYIYVIYYILNNNHFFFNSTFMLYASKKKRRDLKKELVLRGPSNESSKDINVETIETNNQITSKLFNSLIEKEISIYI